MEGGYNNKPTDFTWDEQDEGSGGFSGKVISVENNEIVDHAAFNDDVSLSSS